MSEICADNRFEIIKKAKADILSSTNIETSPEEMRVLDNFLYRCWQMGWLNKYQFEEKGLYMELFVVKDGVRYNAKTVDMYEVSNILTSSLMDGIQKLCL